MMMFIAVIEKEITKERKASLLFLTCSLERKNIITNDPPKIMAVME